MAEKKTTKKKVSAPKRAEAGKPETPESRQAPREVAADVTRKHDRVVAVSYRADGEPDQADGFEVIEPK